MQKYDIKNIVSEGEGQTVEFKSTFDKETIETLAAFANSNGGTVLVGVKDTGEFKGTDIGKETLQNWLNKIKLNTNPSLFPDIDEVIVDGRRVVKIFIQEHPIKPVSCKGRYFLRKKNSNHQMNITQISDLHLKTFNTSWDFYLDIHHKLEDISLDKINAFIKRANNLRIQPINDDPFTVLKKFELLKQDQITNGCYLLFMADESFSVSIEAGRFSSDTVIKDNLTIRTDLISEVDLLIDFIRKHINRGYYIYRRCTA